MKTSLNKALLFVIIASAIDAATTLLALNAGGAESAPLLAYLLGNGPVFFLAFKLGILPVAALIVNYIIDDNQGIHNVLLATGLLSLVAAAWNMFQLATPLLFPYGSNLLEDSATIMFLGMAMAVATVISFYLDYFFLKDIKNAGRSVL